MLGRYQVHDALGEDDFGLVRLASFDAPRGLPGWVALRIAHPWLTTDRAFVAHFLKTAHAAARVTHPNVERVIDAAESDGWLWLAVEYVQGRRIDELLVRLEELEVPAPWDIASRIVGDLALGVSAVEEHGGARDASRVCVSPVQAMVTYEGTTKLIGLGSTTRDAPLLNYIAPECLRGAPPGPRSDVFGLGVLLRELCVGRRLTEKAVAPLHTLGIGCPKHLDGVVARSLQQGPEKRYASTRELAMALYAAIAREQLVVTEDDVGRYVKRIFPEAYASDAAHFQSARAAAEGRSPPLSGPTGHGPSTLRDQLPDTQRDLAPVTPRMQNLSPGPTVTLSLDARPNEAMRSTTKLAALPVAPSTPVVPPGAPAAPSTLAPPAAVSAKRPRRAWGAMLFILLAAPAAAGALFFARKARRSAHQETAASAPPSKAQPASTASLGPDVASSAPGTEAGNAAPPAETTATLAASPLRSSPASSSRSSSRETGLLTVICVPACDEVRDGARSLGPSPVFKIALPAGRHRLTLKTSDPPAEKIVDVVIEDEELKIVKETMGSPATTAPDE
jgi:serine/threonine-protein kinase